MLREVVGWVVMVFVSEKGVRLSEISVWKSDAMNEWICIGCKLFGNIGVQVTGFCNALVWMVRCRSGLGDGYSYFSVAPLGERCSTLETFRIIIQCLCPPRTCFSY